MAAKTAAKTERARYFMERERRKVWYKLVKGEPGKAGPGRNRG
jgi:hypothetical protein